MSTASKLTLLGTTAGAIGIVIMVHYQQQAEKAVRAHLCRRLPARSDDLLGNARRCTPRSRAAEAQARAHAGLRDAAEARGRVSESADCFGREQTGPLIAAFCSQLPERNVCEWGAAARPEKDPCGTQNPLTLKQALRRCLRRPDRSTNPTYRNPEFKTRLLEWERPQYVRI